jgi:hypothetical protein
MPNYIQVKNTNIGSIQIHKGINQGLYSNLGQANSYLSTYINGTYSNVFLDTINDILFFDVPQGTYTFEYFLNGTGAFIIDLNSLLYYANNCFGENTGDSIIEDALFGENAFLNANCNVTINNIIDAGDNFGKNFIGNFTIKGNIGATDSADLTGTTSFFDSGSGANLIVLASKLTSNSGLVEGDLANATINGATVNFVLI